MAQEDYSALQMEKSIHSAGQIRLRKLLREARLKGGLRQADVAQRLGQPQSFVSKYESGERLLDLLELEQVCRALGLSLTDFVREFEGKQRK